MKKRILSTFLTFALLLTLLPTAAFAAGNTIYTDMYYKGVSDGSKAKPYAKFEDALNKAEDGDTIIIKGKAFANAKEESGVTPLVISKSVTITGENGAMGELYVRAGGIMLGADVTMRDVELNLANKYHNAIFVNGYQFTAENVTRGSGSREVHLFAGGIGRGTQVTAKMPDSGSSAVLTLENSTFGSIYAGGVASDFTGAVAVTASDCKLGAVYGSGAAERAPDGNWFDTTEPPAPAADERYAATGSARVSTDGRSVTTVDAKGSDNVDVTVNKAVESRVLTLTGVKTLSVNGGVATVAALDAAAAVTVSGGAALDISKLADPALDSLSGSGKLIMDKTQMLHIAGDFNGNWAFETSGGFNNKSGVAEYGHTYVTSGGGNAAVDFISHDTQSTMTLVASGNSWKTSDAPDTLSYVTTFEVIDKSITVSKAEINAEASDGAEFQVNWMNPSQIPQLTIIPLRYEITWNGQSYKVSSEKDEGNGFYSAHFTQGHMWISADEVRDTNDKGLLRIESDGSDINAGVYQFSVFAPDADGGEIQQNFTLIVTEESPSTTGTTTTIEKSGLQNVTFGDDLTLTATVTETASNAPVDNSAVGYYINGKKINSNPVSVTPDNGFKLDDNELRAIYPGNDTYAVSVDTASVTVSKATGAHIDGFHAPTGGTFDGTAHTGSQTNLTIQRNGTTLDSSPAVTVEYTLDGQVVSQPVFPGTYTVTLSAPEGETYEEISRQSAGSFTIGKAAPTVTAAAEDKGSGTVELTATVSGVGAYFPTGSVTFKLGTHEVSAVLNNGTASQTIKNVAAGTHQYSASYTPADNDALYEGASSGGQSIDVNGSQPQPPVKPEIILTDISITKQPDKMEYVEGEKFDPTGMEVTATYSDNTKAPVTGFTFEPKRALTTNDTSITVSYAENNETRTTTQAITVTPKEPTVTPGAVVTISGAPATATYGDSFTLTATVQNGGENGTWTWQASDNAVLDVTGDGATATVKTLKASTAPVTITANYVSDGTESSDSASITVSRRAITVRADNKSMTVGGTLPALTVSCGNFASGDTADMVFATQAAASTTADGKTAGSFPITVTAPTLKDGWADKYELGTMESGTLTVRAQSSGGSSSDRDNSGSTGKVETTTKPDGTKVQTETKKDGTKVETTTAKDGSTSKTTTNPNGSSVTENKAADGSTGTVKTDKNGQTTAETTLSSKAIEDAKKNGEAVTAPVQVEATRNSNTAPVVNIEVPKSAGETKVEIPVTNVKPGTVAVLVHPDGTEEIIKNSVPTEDGIQLTVNGGATVKIVDNSKDFIDTREHWSRDQVNFVAARELFQGVGNNQFGVGHPMTRGMVNTVLARLAGVDTTSAAGQNWYDKGVAWARENGVSDGTNPNGNVTREQLATMLYRYAGSPAVNGSLPFSDADTASDYAQNALIWATQNGILNGYGDGRIGPKANAERAQVAAMMARFIQNAQ